MKQNTPGRVLAHAPGQDNTHHNRRHFHDRQENSHLWLELDVSRGEPIHANCKRGHADGTKVRGNRCSIGAIHFAQT